jgi:hypothetical protein
MVSGSSSVHVSVVFLVDTARSGNQGVWGCDNVYFASLRSVEQTRDMDWQLPPVGGLRGSLVATIPIQSLSGGGSTSVVFYTLFFFIKRPFRNKEENTHKC